MQSKRILDIIVNSDIDFKNILQMLCIDNKKIKNVIKNDKKINIKYVPCILNVHIESGIVEKYESETAFTWIDNLISKINQARQPPPVVAEEKNPDENSDEQDEDDVPVKKIIHRKKSVRKDSGNYELIDDECVDEGINNMETIKISSSKKTSVIEDARKLEQMRNIEIPPDGKPAYR